MIMAKIMTTCFTDIKGYTNSTDTRGHKPTQEIINEYLRVGKILIEKRKGQYIKNIGDAHMATFDDFELALQFATEFQQFYKKHPCLNREELLIRIALYLGPVEFINEDVFGPGVIRASRVESIALPTSVTLNKDLKEKVAEIWGKQISDKYFESIGEHELKGFRKNEELLLFKWSQYAKNNPESMLYERVFKHLEDTGVVLTNLIASDLALPAFIIWPVVPRKITTAIHRGQIEIIRLLALLGWKIHLLIADCGVKININRREAELFVKSMLGHANYRGLNNIEHSYLSDYFKTDYKHQKEILDRFQIITAEMKLQDLININHKEYSEGIKKQIGDSSTLDFLRPVLTCAATLHLSDQWAQTYSGGKTIVVAGADEQIQWRCVLENISSNQLGAIYNPIFKISEEGGSLYPARQSSEWPIWHSKQELLDDMSTTNAAKWIFQLFAQLKVFPASHVQIGDKNVCARDWQEEFKTPGEVDSARLVELVWPILNPARR